VSALAQQPTKPHPDPLTHQGRYQLVAATIENGQTSEKTVFMIDTETGSVWRFQAVYFVKDGPNAGYATPESFVAVPVEGLASKRPVQP
jgi:hypothetical protein